MLSFARSNGMRPSISDAFMKVCIVSNNTARKKTKSWLIEEKIMLTFLKFSSFHFFKRSLENLFSKLGHIQIIDVLSISKIPLSLSLLKWQEQSSASVIENQEKFLLWQ